MRIANSHVSQYERINAPHTRDLNPGPHGPESAVVLSDHACLCRFQFDSSDRRLWTVQICTDLQLDYYMKYYMRDELASLRLSGHYAPAKPRNTTTARPSRTISSSLKRPTRVRSLER